MILSLLPYEFYCSTVQIIAIDACTCIRGADKHNNEYIMQA